ncbi:MAG: hypothetical protein Q9217_004499 [Psora testacea]
MELSLDKSQLSVMQATERATSIFSILGVLFILSTFLFARGFDEPINRLIFFASWSNLGTNIATLIAEDGPAAGQNSSLCQFQAWAIQMFLGVDVFWALCMSFNVYLALFQKWTAQRMRAQEWKYFVGCYGASFVPALVYLFVDAKAHGRVYGPALLWCWITPRWNILRIATLYGIVWVAIFFAFCIYCLAFIKVWRNRHELSGLFNPFNEDPFTGTKTTDIVIFHSSMHPSSSDTKTSGYRINSETSLPPIPRTEATGMQDRFYPYSVNVEAGPQDDDPDHRPSRPEILRVRSLTRNHALKETNPDAWLYARAAFLFFCALLICWVPSSINRLYSVAYPYRLNFGLNYTVTVMLPLQGFCNACVYIITSQTAVQNLIRSIMGKPELPTKNGYINSGGLDAASGDKRRDLAKRIDKE